MTPLEAAKSRDRQAACVLAKASLLRGPSAMACHCTTFLSPVNDPLIDTLETEPPTPAPEHYSTPKPEPGATDTSDQPPAASSAACSPAIAKAWRRISASKRAGLFKSGRGGSARRRRRRLSNSSSRCSSSRRRRSNKT